MSKWLSVLWLVVIFASVQSGLAPTEVSSIIPMGACCYSDGSCSDNLTQAECEGQGGTYMGDGTTCSGVECVPQPQGACCYSDNSCSDNLTQGECEGQGGTYMGDGTTCSGVECVPQPQGACCYSDNSCSDNLTQGECEGQGGTYMGDGTTCGQVDCVGSQVTVNLDIKPQSCPNPLNTKSKGILPVAILGTEDFDVMTVDPATLRLQGVAPVRWGWEDVSTPADNGGDPEECTTEGPDGYMDMVLKFDTQGLVTALGPLSRGGMILLTLRGNLWPEYDTTPIMGQDWVVIVWDNH